MTTRHSDQYDYEYAGTHTIVRTGQHGEQHRCDKCGKLIEDDTDARTHCPNNLDQAQ